LQFLPITIFVLFAGVIADRVPKRQFLFATQSLAMAQAVALTVLVWSGHVQLWHVYLLATVLGFANALDQPARQAFAIELVGKEDVMNAIALNSGLFNGARLIGPAIAGVIIGTAGVKVAFMLNAISFLPVIGALALMDSSTFHASGRPLSDRGPMIEELREGLAWVYHTPAAMMIVIMLVFVGTFGFNFMVMLPLIDHFMLHRGPGSLGLLMGALGLGALTSALLLAGRAAATKQTLLIGGLAFGLLIISVSLSNWFYATIPLLVFVGMASTAFQATANTSMQLTAPDRLRGRVMSLYMLLFAGSTPVGAYATGQMAEHWGVSWAVGICGGLSTFGIVLGFLYYMAHRSEIPEIAGAPV
jgi:MFS family permease